MRVITLGDDAPLLACAKVIADELRANFVRGVRGFSSDPMKAKISEAEKAKVHTMLVIGGRDMDAGMVSVRLHGKGNLGGKPKGEVVTEILQSIKERRAWIVAASRKNAADLKTNAALLPDAAAPKRGRRRKSRWIFCR